MRILLVVEPLNNSVFQLRIAIQHAANGIALMRRESPEFIEHTHISNLMDLEKGNLGSRKSNDEIAHSFSVGVRERRNYEDNKPTQHHDILTPALKVVHPSAASLHHWNNHPLLTIDEENDTRTPSAASTYDRTSSSPRPSILK